MNTKEKIQYYEGGNRRLNGWNTNEVIDVLKEAQKEIEELKKGTGKLLWNDTNLVAHLETENRKLKEAINNFLILKKKSFIGEKDIDWERYNLDMDKAEEELRKVVK